MRKHKLVRFVVYGAAGLLVLGAIGYAANGGFSSKSHDATNTPGDTFAIDGGSGGTTEGPISVDGTSESIAPAPPLQDGTNSLAVKSGGTTVGAAGSAPVSNGPNVASVAQAPSGAAADALGSSTDRKIVQTATMSLQVKDVGGSFEDVGRIATGAGGFVASSSFSYKGERQIASVTIRVPASSYQSVMGDLRALGVKVD